MLEHLITTVISFTVGGLVMMAIGFFTLKYFVRMVMSEVLGILKKRLLDEASDKSTPKKTREGFVRKH